MTQLSRRDLLRVSGAAAATVPISALAAASADAAAPPTTEAASADEVRRFGDSEPVLFAVHDAARGEVMILHGEHEVVVRDHALVARIVRAAQRTHQGG